VKKTAALAEYTRLREKILASFRALAAMAELPGERLLELRQKLEQNVFDLVVLGQFKRGKTTLINALLGSDILPTAVVPLTSIVTIIRFGDPLGIKVYFNDERAEEIGPEEIAGYVTEKGNPKNAKNVKEVLIDYPSPFLRDGVRLIDTPGVGSVYQHNTDVAYEYLPKSDAAIFLLSVDQPVSQAELDFLGDVGEFSHRIFFLNNKADFVGADDLAESIAFSRKVIEGRLGREADVYPVSAKLALDGKLAGSHELVEQSGLPRFEKRLNRFLMEEKGAVLILSVANNLLRLITQSRFEIELEEKALQAPLDELETKIAAFEEKKKEVQADRRDFELLFDGEIERLIKTSLDEELGAFKKGLLSSLYDKVEAFYQQNRSLATRRLYKAMEQYIIDEVSAAYDNWWGKEDALLAAGFESVCGRFIDKINETVDSLFRFHADLFDIPYETFGSEELWQVKPSFYYKFKDEPVALELITRSFMFSLPGFIGGKVVRRQMKEYTKDMVDRQGGRLRYDFVERLNASRQEFRQESLARIETTVKGLSAAIEKGMSRKTRGGEVAKARMGELQSLEDRLDEIKTGLLAVSRTAEDLGQLG